MVPDPPAPDREEELIDSVLDWLQVNVLRLIATRVIPLILGSSVVVGGLAWLQDEVGIDLPPATLATFVGSAMAGVIVTAFAYVRNHGGAAHIGGILLELLKLRDLGADAPGTPPGDPTQPPGLLPE